MILATLPPNQPLLEWSLKPHRAGRLAKRPPYRAPLRTTFLSGGYTWDCGLVLGQRLSYLRHELATSYTTLGVVGACDERAHPADIVWLDITMTRKVVNSYATYGSVRQHSQP